MKILFLFLAFSLGIFSNYENNNLETSQALEISSEEVLNCDFTYSAPSTMCNASANGNCRGVNFFASGYGVDLIWDFGPNVCSVDLSDPTRPVVWFQINPSSGSPRTVTLETEDYYGDVCIITKTVTFLVC